MAHATDTDILESLNIDPVDLDIGPTTEQRRALFRMGRSRSWIKKYAATRQAASTCIDNAIREMTKLKNPGSNSD